MATAFDALLGSPPLFDAATRAEFDDDFLHDAQFAAHARKRAKHGLPQSHLRSLHWRLFLDLLSPDHVDLWEGQLSLQRRAYDDLLRTYKVQPSTHEEQQKEHDDRERAALSDPSSASPSNVPFPPLASPSSSASSAAPLSNDLKIHNPLSTASSSPWRQYFHNSELSTLIRQDLSRTYPESNFFQHEAIQALMLNVLLVWAKLNAQYEYRQGMNELLAPLVLTVFRDCRALDPSATSPTHPALAAVLDRHYAEHDVFALFKQLMAVMAPFFAKIDQKPLAATLRANRSDTDDLLVGPPPPPSTQSPILLKCHHVHHTLLAAADPPLYKHLNAQDVQPQLYGLRWYRLLFAREFHVSDVCAVWDVLLSQSAVGGGGGGGGGGFVFADYMCVAMLHYVRRELLQGDNTACLRRLLKYPPVEDLQTLIDRALYFSTPQQRGGAGLPMLDQPAVHAHHSDIQRFIAEYGSELENSYLEDPLGLKKGGQAVVDGVNRGIDALAKKAAKKDSAKTLPASLTVNGHSHGLQHSASANSLAPHVSLSAAPIAQGQGPAGKPLQGKAAGVMDRVAHLTAVQMEMGHKLHGVVLALNKEWERVHKATTAASVTAAASHHPALDDSIASIDSANGSADNSMAEEVDVVPHPKHNGGSISVELEDCHPHAHTNGASQAAVSIDMTLLSNSLADLKHIADVLLGRLAYTPSYSDADEDGGHQTALQAVYSPASSSPSGLSSPTGSAGGVVSTFFAPKSVEDPRERLQRLLIEKEREAQQQPPFVHSHSGDGPSSHLSHSSSSSPLSGSGVSLPAALPPKRLMLPVAAPLLVHTRSASPLEAPPPLSSSPASAPASRVAPGAAAPPPPTGPSLFDSTPREGGQSSALALLSSLLGGEKKSVFADD